MNDTETTTSVENPYTEDFRENPFTFEIDNPASGYPLTLDELKVLGRHWWKNHIDTSVYCRFYNSVGSSDLRRWNYAARRLRRIQSILGDEAFETIRQEVAEEFRHTLGDVVWQAVSDGKPIFGDDATDEEKAYYEAELTKVGWQIEFSTRKTGDKEIPKAT